MVGAVPYGCSFFFGTVCFDIGCDQVVNYPKPPGGSKPPGGYDGSHSPAVKV